MRQMNIHTFSNLFLVEADRLFVLVYSNEHPNAKRFNSQKFYLIKGIIKKLRRYHQWKKLL